jgi:2-isopropylmalate synthase
MIHPPAIHPVRRLMPRPAHDHQIERRMSIHEKLHIFDTTLRDGEQAPGASMSIDDKVRIAHQLARLGVDVIEAGFPVSSPAQFEAVRRIAAEVQGPTICALARTTEADIRSAGAALEPGTRTRIHTFIATSDIHIQAKFGDPRYGATMAEKRAAIVARAADAIRLARTFTDDVEFSAEDAGRTGIEFLREVVAAAVKAGATTINIPDTTGYCLPRDYAALFEGLRDIVPRHVVLSAHCHDDLGLAVANSLAAVAAGARQVEVAVNGIGERAGNASLEEVAMALRVRGDQLGVDHGIRTPLLVETSRMVSLATGFPVPPNKAIVGRNAFSHEAGIHQHGVLKSAATYEIMRPQDVGQDPAGQIRLGRHSGRHGFFSRLERLGVEVPDEEREALFHAFTALADHKREIHDQDIRNLINHTSEATMKPFFKLGEMSVTVRTNQKPDATVTVVHSETGATEERTATGDGPVDAIYRAINEAVGRTHELASYSIRSVTEGADAVGEVTVLISYSGAFFRGCSRSTDVLQASAGAYIDALNQLENYRADETSRKFVSAGIMSSFDTELDAAQAVPPPSRRVA